jgi:spore coat protein U-like protein
MQRRDAVKSLSRKVLAAVTALCFAGTPPLHAACSVSATDLAFGPYDVHQGTPTDGAGSVSVNCTFLIAVLLSYEIRLSTGQSGTYGTRTMQGGTYDLDYNLYTDSTRTTVWGDGGGGTGTISYAALIALLVHNASYTVYGRIPALQNVAAGSYSDTITVTLEY